MYNIISIYDIIVNLRLCFIIIELIFLNRSILNFLNMWFVNLFVFVGVISIFFVEFLIYCYVEIKKKIMYVVKY